MLLLAASALARRRHLVVGPLLGLAAQAVGAEKILRTLEHDQIFGYEELLPHWGLEMLLAHVVAEEREAPKDKRPFPSIRAPYLRLPALTFAIRRDVPSALLRQFCARSPRVSVLETILRGLEDAEVRYVVVGHQRGRPPVTATACRAGERKPYGNFGLALSDSSESPPSGMRQVPRFAVLKRISID